MSFTAKSHEESAFAKRLELLYEQGRRHVMHEDDLVDRRLKWAITVSAFLFAAYGATWIAWPKEYPISPGLLNLIALPILYVLIARGMTGTATVITHKSFRNRPISDPGPDKES